MILAVLSVHYKGEGQKQRQQIWRGDCATALETTDTLDSIGQVSFHPQLNSTTEQHNTVKI